MNRLSDEHVAVGTAFNMTADGVELHVLPALDQAPYTGLCDVDAT